uniref:uncharacterized protein K02A2.6-like n=2 Tax=Anopheles coluzzii TaxID=1518534 RepID=UPI0020FF960C|nr:uncharacterized protein K02A2.6-like [Anopheles coluzzii]
MIMDKMLAGLNNVSGYLDDIIVGGTSEKEHDEILAKVFQRIQDFGFTIRVDKCAFKMQQITYLGHVIDRRGLRPDPAKIQVIKNLAEPTDVTGVRSFLGAINFYGKFIPDMRKLRHPLDNLLKANTPFHWSSECKRVFREFKTILSSDLQLAHYDPQEKIVISADASSIGLGATISHLYPNGLRRVVQHASRALTEAERRYSQIDREGLAIIYAVKKFHKMIFGRHFTLQTDHRPLLHIFGSKKGIPIFTANRLQRFALTLLAYDFNIEYVRTDDFGNADLLSRLINTHTKPDEDCVIASVNLEEDIKSVAISALDSLPLNFADLARETKRDPLLKKVSVYISEGWPRNAAFTDELARFNARKDALTTVENCILFGERVVIPKKLQQKCLQQVHQGHPGVQRMKALARSFFYWPTIDADIEEWVKTCHPCQAAAKSPAHSAPVPWPRAAGPWQRLHVDFAGPLDGDYYLIVVDSFSKWPEIIRTSNVTAKATIAMLRSLFARFGIPKTLVSDNGTQFTSEEFGLFCDRNGIEHITTAPYHPQSNGQAERFVDTFKRTVRKISADGTSLQEALDTFLLVYRSSPNPSLGNAKSPADIMLGRQMRTTLNLLRPPSPETISMENEPKPSRQFQPNDLVYFKRFAGNGWRWVAGTIVKQLGHVMYMIGTDDQKMFRSHINQIRKRYERHHHVPASVTHRKLPIDVLLDTWQLTPQPSTGTSRIPPQPVDPEHVDISVSPHQPSSETNGPYVPATSPATYTRPATRPVPSCASAQVPRRSSRVRKPPSRFDVYRRF